MYSYFYIILYYSYNCDEFVVNDTPSGLVDKIRSQLQTLNKLIDQRLDIYIYHIA